MDNTVRNMGGSITLSDVECSQPDIADALCPPGLPRADPAGTSWSPQSFLKAPPIERPRCSHSTMAAIYHGTFKCASCKAEPPSGWLYRCTVDNDPRILDTYHKGDPVAFDNLGSHFAGEMSLGKFGADARSKKNSLLNEMSAEQLSSYTAEQLDTLLSQRESVREAIANERDKVGHRTIRCASEQYPNEDKPWVPGESAECQYKVCHRCYRVGRQKSWVSLDAVLHGDIMPTVATGFSFSFVGTRPVIDAGTVRHIGCRAVPLPRNHPASVERELPEPNILSRRTALRGTITQCTNDFLAVPRSLPSQSDEGISIADFIFEFEYSEHTLACCTPLPVATLTEEISLRYAPEPE
ncbi:hypothetical protein C8A00DRAFT_34644 [Chaetomidium leptoderma]|uniref:Uncharacterized protein n=1 Tax=Chaetomidium leptoderma TaxID=669021 RepID=A0AAN6VJW7_9PEZI|nr:hypothetical protein C8A00DRAFT_34644 [Chaetomidium leptoderma]